MDGTWNRRWSRLGGFALLRAAAADARLPWAWVPLALDPMAVLASRGAPAPWVRSGLRFG